MPARKGTKANRVGLHGCQSGALRKLPVELLNVLRARELLNANSVGRSRPRPPEVGNLAREREDFLGIATSSVAVARVEPNLPGINGHHVREAKRLEVLLEGVGGGDNAKAVGSNVRDDLRDRVKGRTRGERRRRTSHGGKSKAGRREQGGSKTSRNTATDQTI